MASHLFTDIAKKGRALGVYEWDPKKAREWFRNMAKSITRANSQSVIDEAGPFERVTKLSQHSPGRMYFFNYEAKWKDKLPYWDRYPLIFVLSVDNEKGSFLGCNLHYLGPWQRAKFMDALWTTANNDKLDKTTKLKISYDILKSASQFYLFKPCIKRYLWSHLRSPLISINAQYWDAILLLPTARFVGKAEQFVWMESSSIAAGKGTIKSRSSKRK